MSGKERHHAETGWKKLHSNRISWSVWGSMHLDHSLEIGNLFPRRFETAAQSAFKTLRSVRGIVGPVYCWFSSPPLHVWCAEGICCSFCDVGVAAEPKDAGIDFFNTDEDIWFWGVLWLWQKKKSNKKHPIEGLTDKTESWPFSEQYQIDLNVFLEHYWFRGIFFSMMMITK